MQITEAQALQLMQHLGTARDYAVTIWHSRSAEHRGIYERHCVQQITAVAKVLGLELVHRAAPMPPPANVGPDDGLQCDDAGSIVGTR